jgi:hypothetical protein
VFPSAPADKAAVLSDVPLGNFTSKMLIDHTCARTSKIPKGKTMQEGWHVWGAACCIRSKQSGLRHTIYSFLPSAHLVSSTAASNKFPHTNVKEPAWLEQTMCHARPSLHSADDVKTYLSLYP